MAKFAHTISYRLEGQGPLLETVIHAESVTAAEAKFHTVFPLGRIESTLTTVPSSKS